MSVIDSEGQEEKPVRVYIDLVGDLFHAGHVRHLEQARAVGDVLVVGIFSDSDAARLSHVPVRTMEERVAVIAACRWVDEVLPAAPVDPDDGFLDAHAIDHVCLSDDFGDEARGEAFAALMETDRSVVLPYQDAVTTGALVARIVDRPEGAFPPSRRQGKSGARIHPPWQGGSEARALAQLDTKVSALGEGQGAIVQALGSLAAARFSSQHLFRARASGTRHWAELVATFAAETIARSTPLRDDVAAVAPLAARVRPVLPRQGHLVLLGAQAVSVAEVLAEDGPARITVLQPTPASQRTTPPTRKRGVAAIDIIRCDWDSVVERCPPADVCAVLDPLATSFLLIDRLALWQLSERLTGTLLLPGRIAADAAETWRPLNDHTQFVFSDAFVRRSLHEARFFEIRDEATFVDGLPVMEEPGQGRLSRFTYREKLQHGTSFRFLDGHKPQAIKAKRGAAILRWYRAEKGPLGEAD